MSSGGTVFTKGGQYSPVNNVRGDIYGGGGGTLYTMTPYSMIWVKPTRGLAVVLYEEE